MQWIPKGQKIGWPKSLKEKAMKKKEGRKENFKKKRKDEKRREERKRKCQVTWGIYRAFEKLQHTCENPEGHDHAKGYAHAKDCVYAQERPEKVLSSHFWLTVWFCASRKWRLRRNWKLTGWLLKACSKMCTQSLSIKTSESLIDSRHLGNFCLIISWPLH